MMNEKLSVVNSQLFVSRNLPPALKQFKPRY